MPSLPSNFRFVIAGGVHPKDRLGHEYWSELLSRIDEVGCQDRVVFTGFLDDSAEQAAVLKQADVFVLPYDEVGQSGSAVLADVLSCGRPIVTSLARSMFVYRHGNDTVIRVVLLTLKMLKNFVRPSLMLLTQQALRGDGCTREMFKGNFVFTKWRRNTS